MLRALGAQFEHAAHASRPATVADLARKYLLQARGTWPAREMDLQRRIFLALHTTPTHESGHDRRSKRKGK